MQIKGDADQAAPTVIRTAQSVPGKSGSGDGITTETAGSAEAKARWAKSCARARTLSVGVVNMPSGGTERPVLAYASLRAGANQCRRKGELADR